MGVLLVRNDLRMKNAGPVRAGLALLPRSIGLVTHEGGILTASYSPEMKLIVTGGKDKTARIWDATAGPRVR